MGVELIGRLIFDRFRAIFMDRDSIFLHLCQIKNTNKHISKLYASAAFEAILSNTIYDHKLAKNGLNLTRSSMIILTPNLISTTTKINFSPKTF